MKTIDSIKTSLIDKYFDFRNRKYPNQLEVASEFAQPLKEMREKGVSVVENYYTADECEAYRKEIDHLLDKYKDKIWKDAVESDYRIYGADKVSGLIRKFGENEAIRSVGQTYCNTQLKLTMTLAAKLVFRENNLGSGGGWHRDSTSFKEFKSIIYLSDVGEKNGPFTYVEGSHTVEAMKAAINKCGIHFGQFRLTGDEASTVAKALDLKMTSFAAKAGTMILVDTRGLHIGSPIREGSRYALTNYYSSAFRYDKMMGHVDKVILKP